MTYRLDSDIPFNYGLFVPLQHPNEEEMNKDRYSLKTKSAVWMVSNCDTASHRDIYVSELQKYIDVDIIGECNKGKTSLDSETIEICSRPVHVLATRNECLEFLSENYKFYLAFENSLCSDYVTEKFYRAAQLDLIPVVYNGVNMSRFAPPHSYISASDFDSPKALAQYLNQVSKDSALYNSYFWWKPHYRVENLWDKARYVRHFCSLCQILHSEKAQIAKSYSNIDQFWEQQAHCHDGNLSY